MSSEYVHLSFYCITMLFTGRMHKNSLIVQKYILPLISLLLHTIIIKPNAIIHNFYKLFIGLFIILSLKLAHYRIFYIYSYFYNK